MTRIVRFAPRRDFTSFQDQVNRLFQDFNRGAADDLMTSGTFVPPVDIYEDKDRITLKLEVPGIEEKDLDIRLEDNTSDRARRAQVRGGAENFHRIERH